MPHRYVLDTNIISSLLRQDPFVKARMADALAAGDELLLCPVVYYEIYRVLLYRDTRRYRTAFLELARGMANEPLDQRDWELAAQFWASNRRSGYQVADADLLIGSYASTRSAVIVTNNEKDFVPLGVPIENWQR